MNIFLSFSTIENACDIPVFGMVNTSHIPLLGIMIVVPSKDQGPQFFLNTTSETASEPHIQTKIAGDVHTEFTIYYSQKSDIWSRCICCLFASTESTVNLVHLL